VPATTAGHFMEPSMSAQEKHADLDFSESPAAGGRPLPEPEVRPDTPIGGRSLRRSGTYVAYTRQPALNALASAQSPVLIVEDDRTTRRLMQRALEAQGLAVLAVADSEGFVEAIRKPPLPRLVLLDVELPRTSGFKLLSALRQHAKTSAIPVIMVTSRTETADIVEGLSLGADAYLSKPVSVAALRTTVARMLQASAA
jgi:CheY-like chemotaxis protein